MPMDKILTKAKCTLTIAIPTYNRAEKVKRLLSVIREEILSSRLQDQVAFIVSNNASTDETDSVVSEYLTCGLNLEYHSQQENLGFDGNCKFLYMQASTKYVWFMADDDFPLKGAIAKVVETLEMYDPDVLLFSFNQPPGSTLRQFDYPEDVKLITDPVSTIEHVLRYTKVSIFIIRKIGFDSFQWLVLDRDLGNGWTYISLAFSVLETSSNQKIAIVSDFLATCDDDYSVIMTDPYNVLNMRKAVDHPFVRKHNPSLLELYEDKGYYAAIQYAFSVRTGSLVPEKPNEYDEFINDLDCRICVLFRCPRSMLQFMALKLRLTWLWPVIRPLFRREDCVSG